MSRFQNERKAILVDYTRCTGCRACQVACMKWHAPRGTTIEGRGALTHWSKRSEAKKTAFTGSIDNPVSLSPQTLSLINFIEPYNEVTELHGGKVEWRFQRVSCMHCWDAACERVCPIQGCITRDRRSGFMVVLEPDMCVGCKYCVSACPFGVPQYDSATQRVYKCNGCYDRVRRGLQPACVQACPSGALLFGMRTAPVGDARPISRVLEDRSNVARQKGARTHLYGTGVGGGAALGGLGVMHLLEDSPHRYRNLPESPRVPRQVRAWRGLWIHLMYIFPALVVLFALVRQAIFGRLGEQVAVYEDEDILPTDEELERQFEAKRREGKLKHADLPKGYQRKRSGRIAKPKQKGAKGVKPGAPSKIARKRRLK